MNQYFQEILQEQRMEVNEYIILLANEYDKPCGFMVDSEQQKAISIGIILCKHVGVWGYKENQKTKTIIFNTRNEKLTYKGLFSQLVLYFKQLGVNINNINN